MYAQQALEIRARVQREDGVSAACDALEKLLGAGRPAEAVVK
jgi:hypothetical protein